MRIIIIIISSGIQILINSLKKEGSNRNSSRQNGRGHIIENNKKQEKPREKPRAKRKTTN